MFLKVPVRMRYFFSIILRIRKVFHILRKQPSIWNPTKTTKNAIVK